MKTMIVSRLTSDSVGRTLSACVSHTSAPRFLQPGPSLPQLIALTAATTATSLVVSLKGVATRSVTTTSPIAAARAEASAPPHCEFAL